MELNLNLMNQNIDLDKVPANQSYSFWQGGTLVARIEFEGGKVSFITKTETAGA